MKRRLQFISVISLIVFTIVFFSLNPIEAAKLPKGSIIANIPVGKLDENQVKQKLNEAIEIWQMGDDLILKSDFEKFVIPRSAVQFDVDETVRKFKEQSKRHYSNFFLGKANINMNLDVEINKSVQEIRNMEEKPYINFENTLSNIVNLASELHDGQISISYDDIDKVELDVVAEQTFNYPEEMSSAVLTYAINELDGHIIAPNDSFSFLQTVGLPAKMPQSNEELSFLASALYTVTLRTNFEIISRDTDIFKPSFIENGLDVSVNREENSDFIIQNPNEFSFKIYVKKEKDKLEISLNSYPADLTYDYEIKNAEQVKPRTIYRYNKHITPGQSELISDGKDGFKGEVFRHSYDKNGVLIDSELISNEFSLPKPRIVLVSTEDVEEITEETPESDDIVNEDYMSVVDFKDELKKLEFEIEEMVNNYLGELNEKMQLELDEFIDYYLDIIELIESDEEQDIDEMIKQLEKEIEQSQDSKEKLRYQFLLDILIGSMTEDVKEG